MSEKIPSNLKYSKDHEWAKQDQANTFVCGITHHAQDALGEIVYLELPAAGRQVKKGETIGVVESIKAVSDIYSPITGKIVESHSALASDPGQINQDPYDKGWMIKIEVTDPASLEGLMDANAYGSFVASLK